MADFSSDPLNIELDFTTPYIPIISGELIQLSFGVINDIFPLEDPLNAVLDFTQAYTPSGSYVELDFTGSGGSGVAAINILSEAAEIIIDTPDTQVSIFTIILSEATEIITSIPTHINELMDVIHIEASAIQCEIPFAVIEPLVDIETQASQFVFPTIQLIISGGGEADLPSGLSCGISAKWRKANALISNTDVSSVWSDTHIIDQVLKSPYKETEKVQTKISVPFTLELAYQDNSSKYAWGLCKYENHKVISAPYILQMEYTDLPQISPWEYRFTKQYMVDIEMQYVNTQLLKGDFKDPLTMIVWDKSNYHDVKISNLFNNAIPTQPTDIVLTTYWGPYWYSMLCQIIYFPWRTGEYVQLMHWDSLEEQSGEPERFLDFCLPRNTRCPYDYWYSGPRDPFNVPIIPITSLITPARSGYYMLNTAFIQRLPDLTNTQFGTVSIGIDRDSWLWSFNIVLSERAALELIRPQGFTLIDVNIHINGWNWTCRVENWRETRVFGKRTWSVSGRSPSIELAEPYQYDTVFTNIEQHGGQVVDSILNTTGWSADWQAEEFQPHTQWMLPADTINLYDVSKIRQMQHLTNAVSAFIQTNADTNTEQKFIIKPKYKIHPWDWSTLIEPDVFLNDGICHEIGRRNELLRPIKSAIVSGETSGIVVAATKTGEAAGTSPAPMHIDSLVTTQQMAREKARHIIGNSGFWIHHDLKLFSLMSPGEAPGLLLPGMYVQMNESGETPWIGQVTGVNINANWTDGLTVVQNIEVEQYYG